MSSKYLASGTAAFTITDRTIDGATMSVVFDSTDVGKTVKFLILGVVYSGAVDSVTDGNTIILVAGAGLPTTDGTITHLIVLDTTREHEYADYLTEVESKVPQDVEKVDLGGRKGCLAEALAIYNQDKPYVVPVRIQGNGTANYDLDLLLMRWWQAGTSRIMKIEYPSGETPPLFLATDEWAIHSDGLNQDGSGVELMFTDEAPGSTEYFVLHVSVPRALGESAPLNFPDTDTDFANITTLAGSLLCDRLAAAFAQSSNAAISADVIDYHGKTEKYRAMAKTFRERYNTSVFGTSDGESQVQAAVVEKPIDTQSSLGTNYLFHGRR